jgi:hypothetical protein
MAFLQEPSGATVIATQNFNGPLPPSNASAPDAGGWYLFAQSVSITTDSQAPESAPNVGQWRYFAGIQAGVSPGNMFHSMANVTSLFVGMTWKPSNPWQNESQSNVNKLCFIQSLNPANTPGSGHFVPVMRGPGPVYTFTIVLETVMDNSHLGNGFGDVGGTWVLFPNVGSGALNLGQWHRIEILIQNSTSSSAKNGTLRAWINNILVFNYTNVNTPDVWREFNINPTWGGLNNIKTQTDFFWFDHIRLSNPGVIGQPTPPPTISSFTPTSGTFGTPITIVGTNFDPNPGGNSVTLNNTQCTILGATTTQINTAVPNTATTGRLRVATAGGQATSASDFTVQTTPTGTGLLTGSRVSSADTILSNEGTLDWAHWGLTVSTSFNTSGAGLFSDALVVNSTNGKNRYASSPTNYTWVGGTPTASATDTPTGIFTDGTMSFTVPADTTERVLRVYGGCFNTPSMRLRATLSDNSASSYTDTSLSSTLTEASTNAVWILRYKAGEAGQLLTVDLSLTAGNGAQGNVALQAATLQLANAPSENITLSPASLSIEEQASGLFTLTMLPVRSTSTVVVLTNSDETVCAAPGTVTIPANTSSVFVNVAGISAGSATITATLGAETASATVIVIDVPDTPTIPATPSLNMYTGFLDVYRWM